MFSVSVVVADEGGHDENGGDDAEHGQEDRDDCPRGVPLQFGDGNGLAGGPVGVGPHVVRAQSAGGFVRLVLVPVTELAVPAARHPFDPLLSLSSLTRQTAHRDGQLLLPVGPPQLLQLQ